MSDVTPAVTRLRQAREEIGLSREAVTRRPELDPPISMKTLERWEAPGVTIKRWRLKQLARIYGVPTAELQEPKGKAGKAAA
jgi:transcriptional regulator with XRE-family HTH domain